MTTTQRKTKYERNYENNSRDIEITIKAFRKTDNVERLVHLLAMELEPNAFRMLFATEFATIPLDVVFVDNTPLFDKQNNSVDYETALTECEIALELNRAELKSYDVDSND